MNAKKKNKIQQRNELNEKKQTFEAQVMGSFKASRAIAYKFNHKVLTKVANC